MPFAKVNFHFNAWGVCVYPSEASDGWLLDAFAAVTEDTVTSERNGGACRGWTDIHSPEGFQFSREMDPTRNLENCAQHMLKEKVTILLGTVGAFMKIVEPFARCSRKKDQHQKTVLILITFLSVIPSVVFLISFRLGCIRELEGMRPSGISSSLGLGYILFFVSTLLMPTIAVIHLLTPATASSVYTSSAGENKDGTSSSPATAPAQQL